MRHRIRQNFGWLVILAVLSKSAAQAGDIRLETAIHVDQAQRPIAENLTLFTGHMVYDFLLVAPREITIFDARSRRFTLLDPQRKVKTYLDREELLRFVAAVQARAKAASPLIRFAAEPEFDESFDQTSGHLSLSGPPLVYQAVLVNTQQPSAVAQYINFADWYARLNATRPGAIPPGARLALNKAISTRDRLPREVQLVIRRSNHPDYRMKSSHVFGWQLTNDDFERIKMANDAALQFEAVTLQAYREGQLPQQ